MKHDSKSLWPAVVEVAKVKFSKSPDLGIDFSNEIDAWSKMAFKSRHQVKELQERGSLTKKESLTNCQSLRYAFREKID